MSPEHTQFLIAHGLTILFFAVLIEQLGLPVPAVPLMLAAGALAAMGKFSLVLGITVTTFACLLADISWFYVGRYQGNRVLGFLCRISLEPDSCVRKSQNVFSRFGFWGIPIAKFVPGMSLVVPPLAGMSGMRLVQFILADGFGAVLYGLLFFTLGFVFSGQIEQIGAALSDIGGRALGLLALGLGLYIGFKFWQRRSLLRELQSARITAAELQQKFAAGENPLILDLRSRMEKQRDPSEIQGAIDLVLEDVEKRRHEFPHDRDIVVYCSCPNEATAARVALMLQRQGFTRVRPLLGGLDAWREHNRALETTTTVLVSTEPEAPSVTSQP